MKTKAAVNTQGGQHSVRSLTMHAHFQRKALWEVVVVADQRSTVRQGFAAFFAATLPSLAGSGVFWPFGLLCRSQYVICYLLFVLVVLVVLDLSYHIA